MAVHVAWTRFVAVNTTTGQVLEKCEGTVSLSQLQTTSHEHRIIADATLPNTLVQPNLKTYLEAEIVGGFKLVYLGQNLVVTSDSAGGTKIHIAYMGMKTVDAVGNVLDKNTASIGAICSGSSQSRVLPDAGVPSSANFPTLEQYLKLEATAGYALRHLDQSLIITYG